MDMEGLVGTMCDRAAVMVDRRWVSMATAGQDACIQGRVVHGAGCNMSVLSRGLHMQYSAV